MKHAKIISREQATKLLKSEKLALVTGCFDMLHLGHMQMIAEAKSQLGVKLAVAVLNDHEIKRRKGEDRPVFNLEERTEALTHLKDVDYVIPWKHPWEELRQFVLEVKPAYLVVSEGDPGLINKKRHIEKAGGKLLKIKRDPRYSTTEIIKRIRNHEIIQR